MGAKQISAEWSERNLSKVLQTASMIVEDPNLLDSDP